MLAHLSDPHLAPLPRPRLAELASKRLSGYLNWLRKRRAIHRSDALAAIMRDLAEERADHVAVTGDLVNIALPAEFEHARRWLEALGPPSDVSLVPGNHDAYVSGAGALREHLWAPYMAGDAEAGTANSWGDDRPGDGSAPSPRLRGEGRGEGAYPRAGASEAHTRGRLAMQSPTAQTRSQAPSPGAQERADLSPHAGRGTPIREETGEPHGSSTERGEGATFPYLRIRGPVALIGVSTAVPTPPFLATGRLGAPQIARMAALLAGAAAQFRVVLIHHPPHVVPRSHLKRLVDAAAFREAIAAAGAELVIHGHDHVRSLAWIDGPRGRVPVIGVPAASAAFGTDHDAAGYNLYRIDGRRGEWTCEVVRRSLGADGAVTECERFAV